ncbi:hypothetical protein QOZ83_12455 [Romboutsia sedimentorum]|uniref:hypothetical protein n=1 Tax=Romboutsia sedimentorum TaxID=1368474 RepID=UPI0024DE2BFF|nr:hypothetical protein [Romboutsia sedimentorum]MDK2586669.1 hypothetical protein [Romboutsia sedimentorum]
MNINYDILQNLLRCNKNLKLKFRGDSNILDVLLYTEVILTLELESNDITKYSEFIYESILNLEGITIYLPKIYIK